MSANTYVTKQVWQVARKALAGIAGIVVSTTGFTSAVVAAQQLAGFEVIPGLSGVDLKAAPAGSGALSEHGSRPQAALLIDPALKDGLQPGESAYFGYELALSASSVPLADVRMDPDSSQGNDAQLTYEVRQVGDATQCRTQWDAGTVLVAPQTIAAPPVGVFRVHRLEAGGQPEQLCIRVTLDPSATESQFGSVAWRFSATAAE